MDTVPPEPPLASVPAGVCLLLVSEKDGTHVVELLLAGLVCVLVVHLECWRGVDRLSRLGPLVQSFITHTALGVGVGQVRRGAVGQRHWLVTLAGASSTLAGGRDKW